MPGYWKNKLLPAYEIRKTRAQKEAFRALLAEHYGERMQVEEAGKLPVSRNIVIGDPEKAEVIFTAHYDTCARMPFPNFITPKNFLVYLLYQLVITAVLLVPPFGLAALAAHLTSSLPESVGLILTELALLLPFFLEMWLMMAGPANPHTANDNTSGVVAVLTMADKYAHRDDVAFILFDNEEMGLMGSAAYAKAHPTVKKSGCIVNMDCIGDGDAILLAYSRAMKEDPFFERMKAGMDAPFATHEKTPLLSPASRTVYPSDQANFKKTLAVAALKKAPLVGYYMDKIHTPADRMLDERNVSLLTELFDSALPMDAKNGEEC